MARAAGSVSFPVLVGGACICIGLIAYLVYCVMDKKLDQSAETVAEEKEEGFQLKDLKLIFTSKGFWLITILCLMFYAGVFPFLKFATKLMIAKYHVEPEIAGLIPAMLPFGTILLTPVFGSLYDRIGKGATLMVIGSVMLTVVHVLSPCRCSTCGGSPSSSWSSSASPSRSCRPPCGLPWPRFSP